MTLVLASNNQHKLQELRHILGPAFAIKSLQDIGLHADIPETGTTLNANALQKARYVRQWLQQRQTAADDTLPLIFADDTGLEVEALGGAPGVYTARYAGSQCTPEDNIVKLIATMKGETNRRACFRTCIALILPSGEEHCFDGRVDGIITPDKQGEGGFGYDPVFQPDGFDGTFAQLGQNVKDQISHRARATQALAEFLKKSDH
jgi:XTP/dITP diphosphohydrolase